MDLDKVGESLPEVATEEFFDQFFARMFDREIQSQFMSNRFYQPLVELLKKLKKEPSPPARTEIVINFLRSLQHPYTNEDIRTILGLMDISSGYRGWGFGPLDRIFPEEDMPEIEALYHSMLSESYDQLISDSQKTQIEKILGIIAKIKSNPISSKRYEVRNPNALEFIQRRNSRFEESGFARTSDVLGEPNVEKEMAFRRASALASMPNEFPTSSISDDNFESEFEALDKEILALLKMISPIKFANWNVNYLRIFEEKITNAANTQAEVYGIEVVKMLIKNAYDDSTEGRTEKIKKFKDEWLNNPELLLSDMGRHETNLLNNMAAAEIFRHAFSTLLVEPISKTFRMKFIDAVSFISRDQKQELVPDLEYTPTLEELAEYQTRNLAEVDESSVEIPQVLLEGYSFKVDKLVPYSLSEDYAERISDKSIKIFSGKLSLISELVGTEIRIYGQIFTPPNSKLTDLVISITNTNNIVNYINVRDKLYFDPISQSYLIDLTNVRQFIDLGPQTIKEVYIRSSFTPLPLKEVEPNTDSEFSKRQSLVFELLKSLNINLPFNIRDLNETVITLLIKDYFRYQTEGLDFVSMFNKLDEFSLTGIAAVLNTSMFTENQALPKGYSEEDAQFVRDFRNYFTRMGVARFNLNSNKTSEKVLRVTGTCGSVNTFICMILQYLYPEREYRTVGCIAKSELGLFYGSPHLVVIDKFSNILDGTPQLRLQQQDRLQAILKDIESLDSSN